MKKQPGVWIISHDKAPRGKINRHFIWIRYHNGLEQYLMSVAKQDRAIKIAKEWCARLGIEPRVEILAPNHKKGDHIEIVT